MAAKRGTKKKTAKKKAPATKAPVRDNRPTIKFDDSGAKAKRFNQSVRDASRANTPGPASPASRSRGGNTANANARNQMDTSGNPRNAPQKPRQRRKK